jgi:hypothetical protein
MIVGEKIYFRAGDPFSAFSAVVAINRIANTIQWTTENYVISNVAATESLVFVVTHEDQLVIIDADTGAMIESAAIVPSISFFDPQVNPQSDGYHLAVDREQQLLYVLLGDSNQLFAFQITCGEK